jgi:uncharacterized GH25 family protein
MTIKMLNSSKKEVFYEMDYELMDHLNRTLDRKLLDQLSKVYYGHEMWIDTPSSTESTVSCHLRYGHNMSVDGVAPKSYVNTIVYTPDGKRLKADETEEKDGYLLSCPRFGDGDYSFYVDSSSVWCHDANNKWEMCPKSKMKGATYSGAFNLVAKKIIPLNNGQKFVPVSHSALEILPETRGIKVGDNVEFKINYEGGPLSGSTIKAYCKDANKDVMVDIVDGKATVPIDHAGTYMFLVRHRDETKKIDGVFDETIFVTTLVMEAC